jgi:hypothetical protein
MLSELRRLGVPANSLGIARSFIPDLSATGLVLSVSLDDDHGVAVRH